MFSKITIMFIAFFMLCSTVVLWLMNQAYFVTDENNLYQYFMVPIDTEQSIQIRLYESANTEAVITFEDDFYGPIFRHDKNKELHKYWVCNGQANQLKVQDKPTHLIECNGKSHIYDLSKTTQQHIQSIDNKEVYVFADLHGNLDFFKQALSELNIIDTHGRWAFAQNGIIITGDILDKGAQDRQLLWFIYHLEKQASSVGGLVSIILGNHEMFQLKGDFRHAHPKATYLTQKMMPLHFALDGQTFLGRWLRTKPVVGIYDQYLFTHGGVSPLMKDEVDILQLNEKLKEYWQSGTLDRAYFNAIFGPQGVVNYRGLIKSTPYYPAISEETLDSIIKRVKVDKIIVGHTDVEKITSLYNGKVLAINANRTSKQILKLAAGKIDLVELSHLNTLVPWRDRAKNKPFELFSLKHWRVLFSGIK